MLEYIIIALFQFHGINTQFKYFIELLNFVVFLSQYVTLQKKKVMVVIFCVSQRLPCFFLFINLLKALKINILIL